MKRQRYKHDICNLWLSGDDIGKIGNPGFVKMAGRKTTFNDTLLMTKLIDKGHDHSGLR
jgi:hypothetical protein